MEFKEGVLDIIVINNYLYVKDQGTTRACISSGFLFSRVYLAPATKGLISIYVIIENFGFEACQKGLRSATKEER